MAKSQRPVVMDKLSCSEHSRSDVVARNTIMRIIGDPATVELKNVAIWAGFDKKRKKKMHDQHKVRKAEKQVQMGPIHELQNL